MPEPESPEPPEPDIPDVSRPERSPRLSRLRTSADVRRADPDGRARRALPPLHQQDRSAGERQEDEAGESTDHANDGATRPSSRLRTLLLRPGRGQVIAAIFLFVVGMGAVMQVRLSNADDAYTNARREDLIQILDGLGAESRRLEGEITELEKTKSELQSGADRRSVARSETERRLSSLAVLAGTAPAVGPGVRLTITDPKSLVSGEVLLDAVEEMRDAGAEVIEVNDSARVVASSWFGNRGSSLIVDGREVTRPLTIEVIGDPHSLEEAASFRGGLVSEITGPRIGGRVEIERLSRVQIDALHTAQDNQYARPASPPSTPR